MNYLTNETIWRITYRGVDRREYVAYIVAETWLAASALAIVYVTEKAGSLGAIELLLDTHETSIARPSVVLIDRAAL